MRLLGEEWLRPGLKGVAEFVSREIVNPVVIRYFADLSPISAGNQILMRGYGTLPHPNVLGGQLFVGIMINIYLLYVVIPSYSPPHEGEKRRGGLAKTIMLSGSLLLLSTGLVVTFSRIAWAVTGLALLCWFFLIFIKVRRPYMLATRTGHTDRLSESYHPKGLAMVVLAVAAAALLNLFLFGPPIKARLLDKGKAETFSSQESIVNRNLYSEIAIQMIKQRPLAGVGLKNFVADMDDFAKERLLPYMHQPAHNIYLLIAAESGILALIFFCVVIYNIVRRTKNRIIDYSLLIIVSGLLIIGFFDHYLWTIQQGSLMFWTVLGLLAAAGYTENI